MRERSPSAPERMGDPAGLKPVPVAPVLGQPRDDSREEVCCASRVFDIDVDDVPVRAWVPLQLLHEARLPDPPWCEHEEALASGQRAPQLLDLPLPPVQIVADHGRPGYVPYHGSGFPSSGRIVARKTIFGKGYFAKGFFPPCRSAVRAAVARDRTGPFWTTRPIASSFRSMRSRSTKPDAWRGPIVWSPSITLRAGLVDAPTAAP